MRNTFITLLILVFLLPCSSETAPQRKHRKQRTSVRHKQQKKTRRAQKPAVQLEPVDLNLPQCEDTCEHVHGIDLSHYQGNVFWEAIGENANMAYVYLKATEGGNNIDEMYKSNIELAHRNGLKVGSYHFYRAKTPQEDQLRNFMAQCRPGDQDLIPMIDVETKSGLDTEEFCDSLFKFLDLVEKAYQQKPLIYTGANFYDHYLEGKLDLYMIMIAQYTQREPVLADGRDITMWQYTGKGRIDGVKGYVDKSRFMGTHKLREIRFRHK